MANAMVEPRHDARTYRRVEIITGRRRRQTWTSDEKARIVAESFEPEANISEVARRNGVSRGVLNVWRRHARKLVRAQEAMFATVRVLNDADAREAAAVPARPSTHATGAAIEVEIGGATIRVTPGVDRATLDVVITALRGAG
jgi:transposase